MKKIVYKNSKKKSLFIADNIELINDGIKKFVKSLKDDVLKEKYSMNEIKKSLALKFETEILQSEQIQTDLLEEFRKKGFVKARIKDIANKHGYYVKDLENFYERMMFEIVSKKYQTHFVNETYDVILEKMGLDKASKKYIHKRFFDIYKKTLYLAMKNGVCANLNLGHIAH